MTYGRDEHRSEFISLCLLPLLLSDFNQNWSDKHILLKLAKFYKNPFSCCAVVIFGLTDEQRKAPEIKRRETTMYLFIKCKDTLLRRKMFNPLE
jgi:hypothetical protein